MSTRKSFGEVKLCRRVRLTNSPPSVCRFSRRCGILNISQRCRPSRSVTGIAYLFLFYYLANFVKIRAELCVQTCFMKQMLFCYFVGQQYCKISTYLVAFFIRKFRLTEALLVCLSTWDHYINASNNMYIFIISDLNIFYLDVTLRPYLLPSMESKRPSSKFWDGIDISSV
jgi:hypothetical protein